MTNKVPSESMDKLEVSVLVTRPQSQAQEWLHAIQAQGWHPVSYPTLEILPLSMSPQQRSLVLELDRYQGVICISSNAAELGLALLSDYWPQWPVKQQWYAVGPATAVAMESWGLLPLTANQHDSEGMLDLPSLSQIEGQRFLILKGEGGRRTIKESLEGRGAQVDELPLYQRVAPDSDAEPIKRWLNQDVGLRIIVISSGDGLKNLLKMAAPYTAELKAIPLVVVSQRLAQFATTLGFKTVLCSQGVKVNAIMSCIGDFLAEIQ